MARLQLAEVKKGVRKHEKKVVVNKLVKPARNVQTEQGIIQMPPEFRQEQRKKNYYTVETGYNGNTEVHEFATKKDAEAFLKGINK